MQQHAPIGSFDELADAYDRYRIGYANDLYDAIFEYGLAPSSRVLDLGCGTGLVGAELLKRRCRVVGLDLSEKMLARARQRAPEASFVQGRAEDMPFATASFDAAVSGQAFHWFDQPRVFAELNRVVRPGGVVAVWWKSFMRGDAIRILRQEAAAEVGHPPPRDVMNDFDAFDAAPLEGKTLRVVPWIVPMRVADFLGYEHSRALAREAFGERLNDYFAALGKRLGSPDDQLSLSYIQLLYLGRVPRANPAPNSTLHH